MPTNSQLSHSLTCKRAVNSEHTLYDIGYISMVWKFAQDWNFKNICGCKFWRSAHRSPIPMLDWLLDDRHYKPTTHRSPTPVSWVSETRCHCTPGKTSVGARSPI